MKRKILRWSVIVLLVFGTIVALFYAEENWRGMHAWKKMEAELRAKGEPLELAEIIPPEIPDQDNVAMAPVWKEVFEVEGRKIAERNFSLKPRLAKLKLEGKNGSMPQGPSFHRGEEMSAGKWAFYLDLCDGTVSEKQALVVLKDFFDERTSLAREVSESLRLPQTRWPIRYEDGVRASFPNLSPSMDLAKFYQLRAAFYLATENEVEAFEDWTSLCRLADSFRPEPTLISSLVAIAIDQMSVNVAWEGLSRHAWSEKHLVHMQERFQYSRSWNGFLKGMRAERVAFLSFTISITAKDLSTITQLGASEADQSFRSGNPWVSLYLFLRPQGWIQEDKQFYCKQLQSVVDWGAETERQGFVRTIPDSDFLGKQKGWRRNIQIFKTPLTYLTLPSIISSGRRFAEVEAGQRLAYTACAIERYRLEKKRMPDSLEALMPSYLEKVPVDPIKGGDLRYVRNGVEDYILYSVAWNETDDGGITSKDRTKGDWVWPSRSGLVEVRGN